MDWHVPTERGRGQLMVAYAGREAAVVADGAWYAAKSDAEPCRPSGSWQGRYIVWSCMMNGHCPPVILKFRTIITAPTF